MMSPGDTDESKQYWFPAKRYGWGWGPPKSWQGRLVLALFFVLLLIGAILFLSKDDTLGFLVYVATLVAILVGVCYVKGEPPAWRSSDK
jgi:hypothetical protein